VNQGTVRSCGSCWDSRVRKTNEVYLDSLSYTYTSCLTIYYLVSLIHSYKTKEECSYISTAGLLRSRNESRDDHDKSHVDCLRPTPRRTSASWDWSMCVYELWPKPARVPLSGCLPCVKVSSIMPLLLRG
jgi:hypothetical protein